MAISIYYMQQLPMEYPSLNTVPLALLIIGFADFFLFSSTLQWGKKVYNFFWGSSSFKSTSSKSLKFLDENKNQDLELLNKKPVSEENTRGELSICRPELEMVMKSLGIFAHPGEEDHATAIILQGRLSCEDMVSIFEANTPSLDEVKAAFEVFDAKNDGFIDAEELQRVLLALGLNEGLELEKCRQMISVFDENNDGRIDFDEFVKFMEGIDC